MTWIVKAKSANETFAIHCDTPAHVRRILDDQRARGRKAWVEDVKGNQVEEAALRMSR
jgi:hypothetical protein